MTIRPCEACPEGLAFRSSKLGKDHAVEETQQTVAKLAAIKAGRSTLRNIFARLVPSQEELNTLAALEMSRTRQAAYEQRLPDSLEAAIECCEGPFERFTGSHDTTADAWCDQVCGARVLSAALEITSERIPMRTPPNSPQQNPDV